MDLLVAGLLFSLVVMLSFTAVFYRLSPYNGGTGESRFLKWEKVLLYFMIAYPLLSLFLVLVPEGLSALRVSPGPLFRSTYSIFCTAHVFLSAMSAVVSYRLREQGLLLKLFFALNLLAGSVYVLGLLIVFVD